MRYAGGQCLNNVADRVALISLWLIFPSRLLAESLTCALHDSGDFFTGNLGALLGSILPAGVTHIQPLYLNKEIRENREINGVAFNCLMCGRCQEVCPVGLETNAIRMIQRRESGSNTDMLGIWKGFFRHMRAEGNGNGTSFSYLKREPVIKAEVAFFAGCMTHLTPSVIRAMESIFTEAGIIYTFIDRAKGVCCGGSLGNLQAGREVRRRITADAVVTLASSGAATIATGCPLCKKTFAPVSEIPVRDIAELVTDAFYTHPEKRSESKEKIFAAEVER